MLMSLPGDANRVDIARDLLDRFGGAPVSPAARFLDWLRPFLGETLVLAAIVGSPSTACAWYVGVCEPGFGGCTLGAPGTGPSRP